MRQIFILSLLIFTVLPLLAQKGPARDCNRGLILQIAEQQAYQGRSNKNVAQRLQVLYLVADFIWKEDESKARKLFLEAFELADASFKENGREEIIKDNNVTVVMPDYRFEVLRRIAKHDAIWARRLSLRILEEIVETAKKGPAKGLHGNLELWELLKFGSDFIDLDPLAASQMIDRAMAFPIDQAWHFSLFGFARKNQAFANSVYRRLLRRYASVSVKKLYILGGYPFGSGSISTIGSVSSVEIGPGFMPGPELQSEFLTLVLRRANGFVLGQEPEGSEAGSPAEHLYFLLVSNREKVAAGFPAMLPDWDAASLRIRGFLNEDMIRSFEDKKESDEGFRSTFEAWVEKLQKDESENRLLGQDIPPLLDKAKSAAHFEICETWIRKLNEQEARDEALQVLFFKWSEFYLAASDMGQARKYADKVMATQNRAVLYFRIAEERLKSKNEPSEVLGMLHEIYRAAAKAESSPQKAQVLLGLASLYEGIDHFNALSMLSEAIQVANRIEGSDIFTTMVEMEIRGNNFRFGYGFDAPGFDLERAFRKISKSDFSNSINYASNLKNQYLRAIATIEVLRSCPPPPKKKPKPQKVN